MSISPANHTTADSWLSRIHTMLLPSIFDEVDWEPNGEDEYCHRCGATVGPGISGQERCPHCHDLPIAWDRVVRLGEYTEPVSDWIIRLKFRHQWRIASQLGGELAEKLSDIDRNEKTIITSVPMYWGRRWRRGYNQASLIAKRIASEHSLQYFTLLKRTRYTPPQTQVTPSQRPVNVRGSMQIQPVDLTGYHVWLVDDVKTSGSTAGTCTRLLKTNGAQSVTLCVIAVADPKAADFLSL